ncbi:MAG: thiamine pyrophosphate-dependent enzyme [Candidatus Omnitrophica bacterium]|nr:thiamine pyrophosphate-dependent enzyme [Candidatus Omnitrophota bacterium]
MKDLNNAWCPGCGNFGILSSIDKAIDELGIKRENIVMVSGIGQAAKLPHYTNVNFFNGLHGRSIPVATGIKATKPELTVIVVSGDGCIYGEGGNHFIHGIRRNPDITVIVHNNMVYGLTKGQASPTSQIGFRTPIQVCGVFEEPFNAIAVAIALNASFVARCFSADIEKTKEIIKLAIKHKGFSFVEILQPCVTFNKVNTYAWFRERTYYLDSSYSPDDRIKAFETSLEKDRISLGILYTGFQRKTFEQNLEDCGIVYPVIRRKSNIKNDLLKSLKKNHSK